MHQEVEVVANLYDENGAAVIQCNIRDITERKQAEEHNKLLMAEVDHRAINLLAVVQAVAEQTARGGDPATLVERLCERIYGLAVGQDLLVETSGMGLRFLPSSRRSLPISGTCSARACCSMVRTQN